MPPVHRLAADVAGYSRLMGADEEGTHDRLKAHLRELVNPKISRFLGGHTFSGHTESKNPVELPACPYEFDGRSKCEGDVMGQTAHHSKFASNNRTSGTADENKTIVAGSLTHFGTYTVNEADKSFAFRVENATFPNWDETDQKRSFVITGDELKYTTPVATAGGTATVIWKRAK